MLKDNQNLQQRPIQGLDKILKSSEIALLLVYKSLCQEHRSTSQPNKFFSQYSQALEGAANEQGGLV